MGLTKSFHMYFKSMMAHLTSQLDTVQKANGRGISGKAMEEEMSLVFLRKETENTLGMRTGMTVLKKLESDNRMTECTMRKFLLAGSMGVAQLPTVIYGQYPCLDFKEVLPSSS